ncbi:MAG: sigma 54-interacting transcriptional regulator, partial [Bacillota bacterium]|nr:sigma 54-interacting transcriptional regulator [Bacillota bacterium]
MESLMFGSVKGAFTGAVDKKGYLEEASGGTLFLDEIDSVPLFIQSKLLRVIQERQFTRLGGSRPIDVSCRFISATNQNPLQLIKENVLRQDLYFRLSVVTLNIPSLKARREDIPYLTMRFLQKCNNEYNLNIEGIDDRCKMVFDNYSWPGNVRELEHVIEYMMNVTTESKTLGYHDLPPYILTAIEKDNDSLNKHLNNGESLKKIMESYERRVLLDALHLNNNNVAQTARSLDIKRETLYYRLNK